MTFGNHPPFPSSYSSSASQDSGSKGRRTGGRSSPIRQTLTSLFTRPSGIRFPSPAPSTASSRPSTPGTPKPRHSSPRMSPSAASSMGNRPSSAQLHQGPGIPLSRTSSGPHPPHNGYFYPVKDQPYPQYYSQPPGGYQTPPPPSPQYQRQMAASYYGPSSSSLSGMDMTANNSYQQWQQFHYYQQQQTQQYQQQPLPQPHQHMGPYIGAPSTVSLPMMMRPQTPSDSSFSLVAPERSPAASLVSEPMMDLSSQPALERQDSYLPAPVPKQASLHLTIPARNLLLDEAEKEILISPLKEVLQIVHPNEADESPVMVSPGLPHYEPLYSWDIDLGMKPYDFTEHSKRTLKLNKDLPPLQLVSPVYSPSHQEKEEKKTESSLEDLYVSFSDIQIENYISNSFGTASTSVNMSRTTESAEQSQESLIESEVDLPAKKSKAHSVQDSGVSLSSSTETIQSQAIEEEEEEPTEVNSLPPTPLPKSPLDVESLPANDAVVQRGSLEIDTQSFVSCSETVNSSLLPPAQSPVPSEDSYNPYPLDRNGEFLDDHAQRTMARAPSPSTSSRKFSTDSGSTLSSTPSEDTTMNRSTLSVAEDTYKPSFLTLRKQHHALATSNVGEGAKIIPLDHTIEMYRRNCAKTNDPEIQFEFAQFCIKAGDRHIDEGLAWLKRLSHAGFSKAQYYLGLAYADDERYDLAFRQFIQAAKRSHVESTYEVAKLSENGAKGITRNKKRALEYFTKAASAGHAKAMYRLAMAELHGELGLRVNPLNAMKWLNRGASVADENCPEPVFELSLIYESGLSPFVLSDLYHSRTLLIEAAELQYPPALYKLATCFESGTSGFPVNISESIKLYRISSNSGYAPSQLAYAGWLLTGLEGVMDKNPEEAFYWAYQAASQKMSRAEYTVGYFLELGIGMTADTGKALRWYVAAAKHGDELAIKRLKELNVTIPVDTSSSSSLGSAAKSHKKRTIFGFHIGG